MFEKRHRVPKWREQKLSVLMPAHNAQETVLIAVKSTLRAISRSSELIVYLDGCTDNTERIVRSVVDTRLRILVGEQQLGPGLAMNELCKAAKFDLLARLDADDIALPWRFRIQIRAMSKNKSDFEFTNIISFGQALKFGFRYNFLRKKMNQEQSRRALIGSNPFVHSTALMKASAVRELGGYKNNAAEDYDLWLRAAISGYKLNRSRVVSVLFRVHRNQISRSQEWLFALAHDYTLHDHHKALAKLLENKE
jgi:glycosyltransferase involved in cell wall biosynthesis